MMILGIKEINTTTGNFNNVGACIDDNNENDYLLIREIMIKIMMVIIH